MIALGDETTRRPLGSSVETGTRPQANTAAPRLASNTASCDPPPMSSRPVDDDVGDVRRSDAFRCAPRREKSDLGRRRVLLTS